MLKHIIAATVVASAAAAAGPSWAQSRCDAAPALRAVSDLRFGRLVVDRQGGSALLSSGDCLVTSSDGAARLASADVGCAEFELDGGVAGANQSVSLSLIAPRTASFGSGGVAQLSRLTLTDDAGGVIGGDAQGAGSRFTVRLDGAGRSRIRIGALLRVIQFSPGEVRAPVTLIAAYLGCPA